MINRRVGLWLLVLSCAWVASAWAVPDTINTLPDPRSAAFRTQLQTFLRDEDAGRFQRAFHGFVRSGGIGPTSASLTHTISAIDAFGMSGHYVTQIATAATYTASRRSYVYLDSDTSRVPEVSFTAGTGCTFKVRYTQYVVAECSAASTKPNPSVDLLFLFYVDTSATAITSVSDWRVTNPFRPNVISLHDPLIGGVCTRISDDTVALQAALALSATTKRVVEIPANANCVTTAAQLVLHVGTSVRGQGRDTSTITISGSGNKGLVFNEGALTGAHLTIKDLTIEGATFTNDDVALPAVGNLIEIVNAGHVYIDNVAIRNCGVSCVHFQIVYQSSISNSTIGNHEGAGIYIQEVNSLMLDTVDYQSYPALGTASLHCVNSSFVTQLNPIMEGGSGTQVNMLFDGCGGIKTIGGFMEFPQEVAVRCINNTCGRLSFENGHYHRGSGGVVFDFEPGALPHNDIKVENIACILGNSPDYCFKGVENIVSLRYLDNHVGQLSGTSGATHFNPVIISETAANYIKTTTPTIFDGGIRVVGPDTYPIQAGHASIDLFVATADSFDFTDLADGTCETLTKTVTGAAVGDRFTPTIPISLTVAGVSFGWEAGVNTVSIKRCNKTGGATGDPAIVSIPFTLMKISNPMP